MSEQAILNQQPLQTESTDGSNSKQTTNLISSHHATTVLDHDSTVYQLAKHLDDLLSKVGYGEIWNVELTPWIEGSPIPVPQQIILQKFLRANSNDVNKALEQLTKTLQWRKEYQPLKTLSETFPSTKFSGLGYVTCLHDVPDFTTPNNSIEGKKMTCVFNIYGAVKDTKLTFGNLDEFIRWRVALMELTLSQLDISSATTPLQDLGRGGDPYQAVQVHDYLSVSFLRQAAEVKAASQKTIALFQEYYPETMARKFFANVPIVMQWMFSAMSMFMAKETIAKMKWMSYGTELYRDLGSSVPKSYGGNGPELNQNGLTPKYD